MKIHPPVTGSVRLLVAPIANCTLIPGGRPGQVRINGVNYALAYHTHLEDDHLNVVTGYRLVKPDGTSYDVAADFTTCECKDFLTRTRADRCCKHLKALKKLVEIEQLAN